MSVPVTYKHLKFFLRNIRAAAVQPTSTPVSSTW